MKVDETGYELVEKAHPEQVQVAESRLNDGIVENGVEKQKVMIDVALRNPRGVIASLMGTLVKAANALDSEMSEESLKMAKEVDDFLVLLAQQSQVVLSPEAGKQVDYRRLFRLKELVKEVLNRWGDLDFSTFGFSSDEEKYAKSVVNDATKKIQEFDTKQGEDAIAGGYSLAQYINQFYKMVRSAIQKSTDWGDDQNEALIAWDNLKNESDEWLGRGHKPEAKPETKPEQAAPGVAEKSPAKAPAPAHRYSVRSPEVEELQGLLGVKQDGKFGQQTFLALQQAAKDNSLLNPLMASKPKSYQGWDNAGVGQAIRAIRDARASAKEQPAKKFPYETEPHFTQEGLMVPYENE